MGIQLNGTQVPWGFVAAAATVLISIGGLQWQVRSNAEEIRKHEVIPIKVAVLETTQQDIKQELAEINAHSAAQTELLNQAVRQLAALNAKQE